MNVLIRFTLPLLISILVVLSTGLHVKANPNSFNLAKMSLTSTASDSSTVDVAEIINYRREYMKALSAHYRSLETIFEKDVPFQHQALTHVKALSNLAQYMEEIFPRGTAMTEEGWGAKPLIWEEPENFSHMIDNFQTNLETLQAVITNPMSKLDIVDSLGQVRQGCLDCHQTYRVRKP